MQGMSRIPFEEAGTEEATSEKASFSDPHSGGSTSATKQNGDKDFLKIIRVRGTSVGPGCQADHKGYHMTMKGVGVSEGEECLMFFRAVVEKAVSKSTAQWQSLPSLIRKPQMHKSKGSTLMWNLEGVTDDDKKGGRRALTRLLSDRQNQRGDKRCGKS